jgi:hypothetical protein
VGVGCASSPCSQDDDVPFLDGSTLDASMEQNDVPLLNGLADVQWAVRAVVIDSLAAIVGATEDDDHSMLLTEVQPLRPHLGRTSPALPVPRPRTLATPSSHPSALDGVLTMRRGAHVVYADAWAALRQRQSP